MWKKIKNESKFCEYCGSKVEEANNEESIGFIEKSEETQNNRNNIKENQNTQSEIMNKKHKYSGIETFLDIIIALCMVIGIFSSIFLLIWSIYTLVFACISKRIGQEKNIEYGYILGFCLGIFGLLIIAVLPDEKNINNNKYDNLEKLHTLKERGIISDDEFIIEKQKILK